MRLILLILLTLNLLHAKKIALLIGNDDYSFAPLDNPLNDVDGLYKTLKEIGFDISSKDVLKNASQTQMQNALANFSQRAKDAEIAFIYFSGHGMQVNNTNYMLPARTNPQKPVDLWGLVNLDYLIQSATSAKYGIVLVDACRNNPLVKYFQNGKHKGTSAKKGLGQVTPTVGQVVIGFATSAGDTADDGSGNMSPYAKALSVRLKEPNKDITKVLGLVALDVSAKYNQNPIIRTNLAYDVWLNRADEVTPTPVPYQKSKYTLTINPTPKDAQIYIMNIKPTYKDGIALKKGSYRIKVKADGYKTKEFRISLKKDSYYDIVLSKLTKAPKVTSNSKWITPTNSVCKANGGKIVKGVCRADWEDAKKICRASGGRLPSREDLKEVVVDCGGIWNGWGKNNKNSSYQSCYNQKGFSSEWYYWTRETYEQTSSDAWYVYFLYGNDSWFGKSSSLYALCVR